MRERIFLSPVQYEPVKGPEPQNKVTSKRLEPIQYQPLTGVMDPVTIREFRGVNTLDSFSISGNYFTDMSNFTTDDYPTMTTRNGFTQIRNSDGTRVLGMGVWKDTELHAIFSDGTWRKYNGGVSWSTLKSGLSTTAEWSFTNFDGNLGDVNLIGANGVDGLHRYDGTTVQTFGNAPADINHIATYNKRLWGSSGMELRGSALNEPDEWNRFAGDESDSYADPIENTRGEDINMLAGGMSKLVIGMPNSLHELYGWSAVDYEMRMITEETGVSNNKSSFVKDNVLRFIHKTGMYEYVSGGVSPDWSFSEIVKEFPINETVNAAATDGKKFYFLIDTGKMLVYDSRMQTWVVFEGINASCFTIFQNELYVGDSQGRVLRLGGTTDGGNTIPWRIVTKPFTNGSVAQMSKWVKMFTYWELAAGTTMNISLSPSKDGNDWTQVSTITGTGDQIQRIMIPLEGPFSLANMVRIKFEGTGWAKLHEITYQYRELPLH